MKDTALRKEQTELEKAAEQSLLGEPFYFENPGFFAYAREEAFMNGALWLLYKIQEFESSGRRMAFSELKKMCGVKK